MVSWRHGLASVALIFLLFSDGTDARVKARSEMRRTSRSSSGSSKKGDQEPSLSEAPTIVQWGYKNERGVKVCFSGSRRGGHLPFPCPISPSSPSFPCHQLNNTQRVRPDLHPSTHPSIHPSIQSIYSMHASIPSVCFSAAYCKLNKRHSCTAVPPSSVINLQQGVGGAQGGAQLLGQHRAFGV